MTVANKVPPADLLKRYVLARYPVIGIVSHEETRVLEAIKAVAKSTKNKRKVSEWSFTMGLVPDSTEAKDPQAALQFISEFDEDAKEPATIFVMKDMHKIIGQDVRAVRFLRDIAARFETRPHTLILLSPALDVPADLEKTVAVIDWPLPSRDELAAVLSQAEANAPSDVPNKINGKRDQIVEAMQGLALSEAANVLKAAMVATRELSESAIPFILEEKRQIVRKSGALEFFEKTVSMSEVGGLTRLKTYAEIKRASFTPEAKAAGVDTPKGLLMVGPPGAGKSLASKAIAGGKMPLLRFDIGAVMNSLLGKSEENMRSALKIAEAIAPCVLWVDEIEKALGSGGGETDGGTSTRILGTLLTWMQETTAPVYVVATANDVTGLRPELLRRFDDVMFVDLPDAEARKQIFSVHLAKRNITAAITDEDWKSLLAKTWSFSGAEIEKVVKAAVAKAFSDKRPVTAAALLDEASAIIPISVTMKGKIDALRVWAKERAIPAGDPLDQQVYEKLGQSSSIPTETE